MEKIKIPIEIPNALEILNQINEYTLLTLFQHYGCTDNIEFIWTDIEKLSKNKQSISDCYTLLILCCVK